MKGPVSNLHQKHDILALNGTEDLVWLELVGAHVS